MITLEGILYDPLKAPCPKAKIRFTALSDGGVLKGVSAEHITSLTGAYAFNLEYGYYRLEVLYTDEYHESGSVVVSLGTPSPINLVDLVRYTLAYEAPLIDPEPTVWGNLFQHLIDNDLWERELEAQVRDETTLVNSDKTIHSTSTAKMARETLTAETSDAHAAKQILAYSDEYGRNAAYDKTELEVGDSNATSGVSIYDDNDNADLSIFSSITGANGALDQSTTITTGSVTDTKVLTTTNTSVVTGSLLEDNTVTQDDITSAGNNKVFTKKYIDANALVESLLSQGITVENVEAFDKLKVTSAGSKREIQVDEFNIGTTFSVNTKTNVITIDGQLNLSSGDSYKGPVGDSQYYEYSYASTEEKNTNTWYIDNPQDPYDIPVNSVVWRRHRLITTIDGVTNTGAWSEPYLLTGKDGEEGDTLYWVFKYSVTSVLDDLTVADPPGWSDVLQDGMFYRTERLINNGAYVGTWSVPAKIAGADGDNGEIVFEEYMYSPNGTSTPDLDPVGYWHSNFVTGDFFRSSRLVKYAAGTAIPIPPGTTPSSVTSWSIATLIVPRKGYEYVDGSAGIDGYNQSTVIIYKRGATAPTTPIATLTYTFATGDLVGTLEGWSLTPTEGTGELWASAATAISRNTTDDIASNEWAAPIQWAGTDGISAHQVLLYQSSEAQPALPITPINYTFATGVASGNFNGWSVTPPANSAGTMWFTFATALASANTPSDFIQPEEWSSPVILAQNGIDGTDGTHGAGSYIIKWQSTYNSSNGYPTILTMPTVPTEAYVEYWFSNFTGRDSQELDIITFQMATSPEDNPTISYLRGATDWEEFALVVDGNQIVKGTLAADRLKSGTVITDVLYAASATNLKELTISGSGDIDDPQGRLWAGHEDFADAPFSVDKDGNLKATNADITGSINATSITLDGPSVQISGNYTPGTTGWMLNSDGSAELNNATFRGTLVAQGGVYGAVETVASGETLIADLFAFFGGSTVTNNSPLPLSGEESPSLIFPAGDADSGKLGVMLSTGYISVNHYYATPHYVLSYSIGGAWGYKIGEEATAGAALIAQIVPFTGFPTGGYNDAELYMHVLIYTKYAKTTLTSTIKWKINKLLLNI